MNGMRKTTARRPRAGKKGSPISSWCQTPTAFEEIKDFQQIINKCNIEICINRYWFISFNPNMPMMETFQFWNWLLHQLQSASCLNTCPISVQWWIQKEDANPRVDGFERECWSLLTSKLKLFRVISGDSGSEIFEEGWKIERVDVWIPGQSSESGLVKLYLNTGQHEELLSPSTESTGPWLGDDLAVAERSIGRGEGTCLWAELDGMGGSLVERVKGQITDGLKTLMGLLRCATRMQFTKGFRLSIQPGCLCCWWHPSILPCMI